MTETQKVQQEKPPSYNQRLIQHLEDKKVTKKTIDLIKSFALEETTRREEHNKANEGIINFGKYKTKRFEDIFKLDPTYIKWLHKNNKYLSDINKEIVEGLLKAE